MYKVLVPKVAPGHGIEFLRERGYDVVIGSADDPETIKRECVDADAILAWGRCVYTADVIAAGRKLKIISRHGVGFEFIDTEAAERQGVYVTITRFCNHVSVAEHTMALILACAKRLLPTSSAYAQDPVHTYKLRSSVMNIELRGKILAVIGLGVIGRTLAEMAHFGFGMELVGFDLSKDPALPDYIRPLSLADCFNAADVLSVHVPLTPETRNLVNIETLSCMKPTAFVVNCARGGIVNEDDLYLALKEGRIAGAGLDCVLGEPPDPDFRLFALENCIITPHTAGMTAESQEAQNMCAARAIDDVLSGREPEYPVNDPKRGLKA